MTTACNMSSRSYHYIVVHVSHVVDIHRDLCRVAVIPRGAGRGHRVLTWLAVWGELKIGAVWLPVTTKYQEYKLNKDNAEKS